MKDWNQQKAKLFLIKQSLKHDALTTELHGVARSKTRSYDRGSPPGGVSIASRSFICPQ